MTTLSKLIARARKQAGLNQSELARKLNITPQSVQAWESGRAAPRPSMLGSIGEALGIPLQPLLAAALEDRPGESGQKTLGMIREMLQEPPKKLEASMGEPIDVWDDSTPVDADEVEVPFLREVELSAGSGRTAIETSSKRKLRFGKLTLRSQGVQFDKAVCVTVHGNSMSPILPDGSTVGVDTGSTIVRDGKTYAINHDGQLRVKTLDRLPNGGIRLRSFNREEYPDEEYSLEEMADKNISIIGRVFWSSVLW
ncbi:XRE family transcriptional regulator [Pseudomonas nitroreducens]|uniref:XRE family transcriptional regulator n=1 Tax=Pseudomonas nitroreducens TaxID=46680 RepID=UPI002D7E5B9B|nr:S24 family peptidase [Pseudomonas nitroreducens]